MGEHELLSGANNGCQQQQPHHHHHHHQQQQQISQNPNPNLLVCIQTGSSITNDNNSLASSPLPKSQNSSAINVNSIINGNINAGLYIVCHIFNVYPKLICVRDLCVCGSCVVPLHYMLHVIAHAISFIFFI